MAVKIKLKRLGKIRSPHYRIVVADSRTRRDGRAIEEIGLYHPVQNPSRIEVDTDRGLVRCAPTTYSSVVLRKGADSGRVSQHGDRDRSRLYSRRIRMGEKVGVAAESSVTSTT